MADQLNPLNQLDKLMELMAQQITVAKQQTETVQAVVKGVEALSDRMQLLEMKAEADERERLEIDREKLKLRESIDQTREVQLMESDARKLIAADEQRALEQILNDGDITDPKLLGRFGMVSGGNIRR